MRIPLDNRLRVLHVIVQPVLVWDNGDELTPGPEVEPSKMSVAALVEYAERMPVELQKVAAQISAAQSTEAMVAEASEATA